MRKLRPILARVLIAGLIGAVVTVGVAVGWAMRPARARLYVGSSVYWKHASTGEVFVWSPVQQTWHGHSGYLMSSGEWPGVPTNGTPVVEARPFPREAIATPIQRDLRQVRCEGWPCRCLWGTIDADLPQEDCMGDLGPQVIRPSITTAMISVPRRPTPIDGPYAVDVIPIAPIWSGLAINTLFYGTIAWALMFLPGTLRRWRRVRAGRCVKCGYDRAGLAAEAACPECGEAAAR